MTWRIEFAPAAERELRKLSKSLGKRDKRLLGKTIDDLADDPYPEGSVKLAGSPDIYRVRQGNFRVSYCVREKQLIVLVLKVGDRKDFYRRVEEMEKRAEAFRSSSKT